jgi:hypothetical protein
MPVRWHRAGFRSYRSRALQKSALGRAAHGALLKLGFEVAQSSVAKYMV